MPDSLHACSVALPTWASVVGYEENDPAVTGIMQAGYPRFFCHPTTRALFALAGAEFAAAGEMALVFPSAEAAERCVTFLRPEAPGARRHEWTAAGLWAVVYPEAAHQRARYFWRLSGEIVSSRMAAEVVDQVDAATRAATAAAGAAAREIIRDRLAALNGQPGENVFLFASGMGAVSAVQRALTTRRPGRPTVQTGFPYVDVLKVQQDFGAGVHFYPTVGEADMDDLKIVMEIHPVAGIYAELPSNPLLECVDLEHLSLLARRHGVPLVADDTVATVCNIDVTPYADLITTSLTKAFSGAGDVLAGCVTVNSAGPDAAWFCEFLRTAEAAAPLAAPDAIVLEENSRDFTSRVPRLDANALALAEFLRAHPAVDRVWYTPFTTPEAYEKIRRPGGGFGCLLSFTLREAAHSAAVFDALRVTKGPSLGTNFTLACPYTLLAHYPELDWAAGCGVPAHLIRVSAGLEETADLIDRFAQALAVGNSGLHHA